MSFSLSFVVAIASNVLVPIRRPLPLPHSFPSSATFFLLCGTKICCDKQRQMQFQVEVWQRLPACPTACLPVCVCGVCACWHAADTVTFTVLPNVFVACLFVRPAVCPLPTSSLSVRPSVTLSLYFPFRFVLCPFSCRPTAAAFSMHPTLFVWPQ